MIFKLTLGGSRHSRLELAAVTTVAFAVRLGWVLLGPWESGDSAWYLSVARNIAFHRVFSSSAAGTDPVPTAYRPPLYPAVIAALWLGDSAPIMTVLLLQAFLGAITVSLVYLIAHDQYNGKVALVASFALAFAPMSSRFTAVILTETLFIFLITLGFFLWGRARYVLTGLVVGLAMLTRPTLFPFLLCLPLLTFLPAWRSQRLPFVVIMLVAFCVSSIWIIRDAIVFRRLIPISASGYGTNLLLGTMEIRESDNAAVRKALLRGVDESKRNALSDETESDRVRSREALRRIRDRPLRWLIARAQQYPRLFYDSGSYLFANENVSLRTVLREGPVVTALIRVFLIIGNLGIFILALAGIVVERSRFVSLSHIILFPLFLSAIHLPLWVEPRYGLPMMPAVLILAAVGLLESLKFLSLQKKKVIST